MSERMRREAVGNHVHCPVCGEGYPAGRPEASDIQTFRTRGLQHAAARERLLDELRQLVSWGYENGHIRADELLLEFIGDAEVTAAFEAIDKWYA